eukprot:Lithocolla_globosa_v1_NODE_3435_length_1669_cov_9.328996.p1 type:complete len:521 gc:universal NODE_3435_length_1669_cov_9.328996:1615-53(-)
MDFQPTLAEVTQLVQQGKGNTIPIFRQISSDLLTPVSAYLKISHQKDYSFLFESVHVGGEKVGRYSFIGAEPYKILKSGISPETKIDPLIPLETELNKIKYVPLPKLPSFTGGAVGYVSFDCIEYFEPKTKTELRELPFELPESIFMFMNTLIIFDHLYQVVKVVSHYQDAETKESEQTIKEKYEKVCLEIERVEQLLQQSHVPLPEQPPIKTNEAEFQCEVGQPEYEEFVRQLKHHIFEGDIMQAVPSRRVSRKTDLHPFNCYRHLRSINPSPYMFYQNFKDFQVFGASPEMLAKVEDKMVETHPIAGTRKRGATKEEDERLAQELLSDEKERAEHIMLVDLGRNDVNRVCIPETCSVTEMMIIEKYSHVMHIVSKVVGKLRPEKSVFDAFRSIFPAGTVSGAPKVRALQLIRGLEKDKRGIYAGAVGYFDYNGNSDTCIAIRTMVSSQGTIYFQSGGGIVHDSNPTDEYEETVNKLNSNLKSLAAAEAFYSKSTGGGGGEEGSSDQNTPPRKSKRKRK